MRSFDTTSTKLKATVTMAIVLPRSALTMSLTDFNEYTDGLASVCLRRTTGKCPSYTICNSETMFGTNEVKIESFMLIPRRATDWHLDNKKVETHYGTSNIQSKDHKDEEWRALNDNRNSCKHRFQMNLLPDQWCSFVTHNRPVICIVLRYIVWYYRDWIDLFIYVENAENKLLCHNIFFSILLYLKNRFMIK